MKNTMIKFGMGLAFWGAIGTVIWLLFPPEYFTNKFWLSMGTLVLASALFFTRGIIRRPAAWGTMGAEADDARILVSTGYCVAVMVLAVIAMIPFVSFTVLGALHILAALILVFGWGSLALARNHLETPNQSVAMTPPSQQQLDHEAKQKAREEATS